MNGEFGREEDRQCVDGESREDGRGAKAGRAVYMAGFAPRDV